MPDEAQFINPFPGLRPFESSETHLFFGRDGQSDELLRILANHRFVAVVGTSGSGKSSLVRAGVLPALQRGFMIGAGSSWRIAMMRPGASPIENLATALDLSDPGANGELGAGSRQILLDATLRRNSFGLAEAARMTRTEPRENLLLVVDQFEEIFRLSSERNAVYDVEDAAEFVRLLTEAVRQLESPIYVLITMRSDFLGDCAQFQGLPEIMNRAQYLIPRMTREQRREAIEGPVAVGGATITPRLIQRLLNDVGDAPDQLPILQHAMMRTWDAWQREGKSSAPIDLEHYASIGGMSEALSRHAEEAYAELDDRSKEIARRLFECISHRGPDNREVRRPTRLSEICAVAEASEDEVVRVIDCFRTAGRTFLAPPAPEKLGLDSIIDISHESLIRLWGRLREWTREEAESAATYRRLADDAAMYKAGRAALWRDPGLTIALDWKATRKPSAAWAERYAPGFQNAMDFLERSSRSRELSKWSRRAFATSGFVLAAVAFMSAGIAYQGRLEQQRLRKIASARQLVADAQIIDHDSPDQLDRGALLAVESAKRSPLLENDTFLRHAEGLLQKNIFRHSFPEGVSAVAFSPDSQHLAVATGPVAAILLTATGAEIARLTHDEKVLAVAFSPDGSLLASASRDNTARVFVAATGKEQSHLIEDGAVLAIAFDPKGQLVATGSYDQTARVFNSATGKEVSRLTQGGIVDAVAFSADGRLVATGSQDNTARVFDAATGKEVSRLTHGSAVWAVGFSPNGRYVATGSADSTARVFEADSGKEVSRLFHSDAVDVVAFSPDGSNVATGSADKTARVFEAATGREISRLIHADTVNSVAFSRDGRYVATGSSDKTARVFEVATGWEVWRLTHRDAVKSVAFALDGRYLATGAADGSVALFDLTKENEVPLPAHDQKTTAVAFSRAGRLIATGWPNDTVEVFDAASGKETLRLKLDSTAQALALSPDGRFLAIGGRDRTARVFDATSAKEISHVTQDSIVDAVAFSPDGRFLATGSHDQTARVVEVATGKQVSQLRHGSVVDAVAVSPNGRFVATGSYDSNARVFEAFTGKEVSHLKHDDTVDAVAFSPDGEFVASGSQDKTARVFEAATGKEIWRQAHGGAVVALLFSSDGRKVVTSSSGMTPRSDKTVRVFDARTGKEISRLVSENLAAGITLDGNDSDLATVSRVEGRSEIVVTIYPLTAPKLIQDVCAKVKRNLTLDEWKRYVPDEPYQKTCSN